MKSAWGITEQVFLHLVNIVSWSKASTGCCTCNPCWWMYAVLSRSWAWPIRPVMTSRSWWLKMSSLASSICPWVGGWLRTLANIFFRRLILGSYSSLGSLFCCPMSSCNWGVGSSWASQQRKFLLSKQVVTCAAFIQGGVGYMLGLVVVNCISRSMLQIKQWVQGSQVQEICKPDIHEWRWASVYAKWEPLNKFLSLWTVFVLHLASAGLQCPHKNDHCQHIASRIHKLNNCFCGGWPKIVWVHTTVYQTVDTF